MVVRASRSLIFMSIHKLQGNKSARAGGNSVDESANSQKNNDEVDVSAIKGMITRNEVELFDSKGEVDTGPAQININPLAEENIKFYHSQVAKTLSIPVQRYRVSQRVGMVIEHVEDAALLK